MRILNNLTNKYGNDTGFSIKCLLKTALKLAKTKNKLKFLLHCRKCKIVPNCLNYKVNIWLFSEVSRREKQMVEQKQKIRMMSVVISDTKRQIEVLKTKKSCLSQRVQSAISRIDWERTWSLIVSKSSSAFQRSRNTEMEKVNRLKMKKISQLNMEPTWIENTTDAILPDYLERTLMLGPNFNIQTENNTPYIRIVADVENAIKTKEGPDLDDQAKADLAKANQTRAEVATIIANHINYQHQPRTKYNDWIKRDITRSQRYLREHPELYITKADKGNKVVVFSAEEYRRKMAELVADTQTYKKTENPTNRILKKQNEIIDGWYKEKYIDYKTKDRLNIYNCLPPRIYGLPKLHKPNRPLRPVVSTVGTATYQMAQYLANILGKLTGKSGHHVKNSFDFAEEVSRIQVPEGCVMFSLDVVSLYTNVPVEQIYTCIEERWHELREHTKIPWPKFKEALKTVLESSYFQYEGKFYAQIFGVPMGSPLSPAGSNVVLEKIEQQNIEKLRQKGIVLHVYKRYVDDCFVVAREDQIDEIVAVFNSTCESLQFTVERETDASIRFLDLTLTRAGEKIEKKWFPKQEKGRYLDYNSESPHAHKVNTAIALLDRALLLTDVEKRAESISVVRRILRSNNYPEWFIKRAIRERVHLCYNTLQRPKSQEQDPKKYASIPYVPGLSEKIGKALRKHDVIAAYKPNDKIKTTIFTKLKDKVPKLQQTNVVYSIPCGACEKEYIGQTTQTLGKRISQHKSSVSTNTSATGLTEHSRGMGHVFNFARADILEKVQNDKVRLTAEMLHIKMRAERTVNLQRESTGISSLYNGVLGKLRRSQEQPQHRANTRLVTTASRSREERTTAQN